MAKYIYNILFLVESYILFYYIFNIFIYYYILYIYKIDRSLKDYNNIIMNNQ
jgi:hypothetical protein